MKKVNIFNYHITNRCNYHCTHCFGKFCHANDPTPEEAKKVIHNISAYFRENQIDNGRINFAGGEPLLYPHIDAVIEEVHKCGLEVSVITNGSLLTIQHIRHWREKVSCIGLSIDAISPRINQLIGRCEGTAPPLSLSHWETLAACIHEHGIALKINTVVSRINLGQNLTPLYDILKPQKVKLLQMHIVKGINQDAQRHQITKQEFEDFCLRHKSDKYQIVTEELGDMQNSYVMINPQGHVILNDHGVYRSFGHCCETVLSEILKDYPLDIEKFQQRYTTS